MAKDEWRSEEKSGRLDLSERLDLRTSKLLLHLVDQWRRAQKDKIPSRSEAIRKLTMLGLKADRKSKSEERRK
jgi:hypothetical protein